MSTVTRLLRSQGGLTSLSMNGFLAKLLSFIDTNSSFLLGTNLYFVEFGLPIGMPHHQPFGSRRIEEIIQEAAGPMQSTNVVNLERFIGITNVDNENNETS